MILNPTKPELQLIMRNKFGKELYYPHCEISVWLCKLMSVKSFPFEKLETLGEKYKLMYHDCKDKRPLMEWKELI
tara:strand:- start:173 stop:397 length:225 start_codon:yes stop_codon:yes gene_type:complete